MSDETDRADEVEARFRKLLRLRTEAAVREAPVVLTGLGAEPKPDPRPPVGSRWRRNCTDQILRVVEHVDCGELPARRGKSAFRYVREDDRDAGWMEWHLEAFNPLLYTRLPDAEPGADLRRCDRCSRLVERGKLSIDRPDAAVCMRCDAEPTQTITGNILEGVPPLKIHGAYFMPLDSELTAEPASCRSCGSSPCAYSCARGGWARYASEKKAAEDVRAKREEEARARSERERRRSRVDGMTFTAEQAHVSLQHAKQAKADIDAAREASAAAVRPFMWTVR